MGVKASDLKRVITTLLRDDEHFGVLRSSAENSNGGGRPVEHIQLAESQAIKVVLGSKSKRRFALQHALVTVFLAVKRADEPAVKALPSRLSEAAEAAQVVLLRAGVREGIASAAVLAVIEQHTGVPMEQARRALPADTQPSERLNPTKLGAELGIGPRDVNLRLAAAGLQTKGDRDPWMLTDAGKRYGEAVPFANGKRAGNQLLWSRDVLEVIR
jgi:hypothetical protein